MTDSLHRQAQRLYQAFAELARGYQFRNREEICCHGISVSQCYTLDALETQGPMTMGELAGYLHLEISSMTRVVDYLVANKLVKRVTDTKDRRVCRVQIARKGQTLVRTIRADLIRQHEVVLAEIRSDSREAVISAVSRLLDAFKERERSARAETSACRSTQRRAS